MRLPRESLERYRYWRQAPIAQPVSIQPATENMMGSANAAFVGSLFGTWGVATSIGMLDPTIVGHVNDKGIVTQALLVQQSQQLAACFVEPFAHGVILSDVGRAIFRLIFLQQPRRRIVRSMG